MPLITRQLTNVGSPLYTPDGVLIANKTISFLLVNEFGYATSVFDAVTKERIYGTTSAITSAGGEFSVNLWPNDRGDKITYYACTISDTSVEKITSPVPSGATALSWFDFKLAGTVLTPIEVNALNVHINDHNNPHQVTKTQVGLSNVTNAAQEVAANKDASNGYSGLTQFKLNMKNVFGTITSFLTNSNTTARTYTLQDRDGTIADLTDIATRQSALGFTPENVSNKSLDGTLSANSDLLYPSQKAVKSYVDGDVVQTIALSFALSTMRI